MITETLEQRVVLSAVIGNNIDVGDQLQNYRMAIAATAEYTALLGGQSQAFAAIQTFVSDLNAIFETELSIHFDLVSGLNTVFTNSATDGFTNGNTALMLNQNTGVLNNVLGSSAYDIGHVFGTAVSGGAGLAGLGVVNHPTRKGEGASISVSPQGVDWVGLVGHEIAHQFAAKHSFNANTYASTVNNRESDSAYEPASGTTLMSYAGISGPDDLQSDPDPYFHAASFEAIQSFVATSGAPNSLTSTGNSIPTVSGGADYVIPAQTPFQLTASGSDADNSDVLTYTWEQLDLGAAMSLPIFDNGNSPLFRSFPATIHPTRVFPRLSDLVANVNTAGIGELLPTTTRELNFRTTVRDGRGGVNSDDVLINVVSTGTPFAVTTPNSAVNWTGGTTQTILWNNGGTTGNGINVANVGIDLSIDGGMTYPITLAASVPNDGSQAITVPNLSASQARVRVRAIGNVFFDLSDVNFAITADVSSAGITTTESNGVTRVGELGLLGNSPVDTYSIQLNTFPAGAIDLTVSADSQTEVSLDGVTFTPAVIVTRNDMSPATIYVRGFDDSSPEGVHSGIITHTVSASNDLPNYPLGPIGNPISVTIADDELQPVVGIDFDQTGGLSPTNWTKISSTGVSSNLIREDGFASGIGMTFAISGGSGPNGSNLSTAPNHAPALQNLNGNYIATESMTLTWTGLTPSTDYNVYLFAGENFGIDHFQQVTITGGTSPAPFEQDSRGLGSVMLVNSATANSGKTIETDAILVRASAVGQIQIFVDNLQAGDFAILAGAAIQLAAASLGPLTLTVDTAAISENGGTTSATVRRGTATSGDLTVQLSSGDTSEATVPTSVVIPDGSDSISFVITAVNDNIVDGTQTIQITATAPDYESGIATLDVTDDDIALVGPLIGIDFDSATNSMPTNWTRIGGSSTPLTVSNLMGEDGIATAIDLSILGAGGSIDALTATPNASTIPTHTQSLNNIGGQIYTSANPVTFLWSDLAPGESYEVYVFGLEPFFSQIIQDVTITGSGAPIMFQQSFATNQLFVNDRLGSSSDALDTFAIVVIADANGEIEIQVDPVAGTNDVSFGGLAIREVFAQPSYNATFSVSTDGNETGPVDIVFTATLDRVNDTGAAITFDVTDLGTGSAIAAVDYVDLPAGAKLTIPNGASSGTFTVNVLNDPTQETTETVVAQLSNPSVTSVTITTNTATGQIIDNDSAPTLSVNVLATSISESAGTAATSVRITRGGDPSNALDVMLRSSDTSEANLQPNVTIPAGQSFVDVNLNAIDDTAADGTQLVTIEARAAAGVAFGTTGLDSGFGTAGIATTQLTTDGQFTEESIAVQADGKIVAATRGFNSTQVLLTRLRTDGTTDTDFGNNGIVVISVGATGSEPTAIAIDQQGRIVVGGSTTANGLGSFLARVTTAGLLDSTFGNAGLTLLPSLGQVGIQDIGLTPNGKILAAVENFGAAAINVIRINTNGTVDQTFGINGLRTFHDFDASTTALEVLPDGRFLVAGNSQAGTTVIRSLPDGTLDTSFGIAGSQVVLFDGVRGLVTTLTLLRDGGLLLGGSTFSSVTRNNFAVAKLTASGLLDLSFGGDGTVVSDLQPSEDDFVTTVLQQPDGKVLAIGTNDRFTLANRIAIVRYNANGSLDTSFDGDGVLFYSSGTSSSQVAIGSALDAEGRLVTLAGGSNNVRISRLKTGVLEVAGADSVSVLDNDSSASADFGDAPSSLQSGFIGSYPVTIADFGAQHTYSSANARFGNLVEAELDGVTSVAATFDDSNGSDDEDGVAFFGAVIASTTSASVGRVQVDLQNASASGNRLDAWIDFNRDGDWSDAGEKIFDNFDLGLANGLQTLNYAIPMDTGSNIQNGYTFARFRLSESGGLSYDQVVATGEVEDHRVALVTADALIVDSLVDQIDGDYSAGNFSLREAIDLANSRPGADEIQFSPALGGGTITLSVGQLAVVDDLTISGLGSTALTIDGDSRFRIFNLKTLNQLVIDGLTLTNGQTSADGADGGGIRSRGHLELRDVVLSNNRTIGNGAYGGAIRQFGGSLVITDSLISNNSIAATNSWGAGIIAENNAPVTLTRSRIVGNVSNSTGGIGGGIVVFGGVTEIVDSTIANNQNTVSGVQGAGLTATGNLMISGSTISGNSGLGTGGGILWGSSAGTATITHSTISGNSATEGGGISVFEGVIEIIGSTITNNTAPAGLGSGIAARSTGTNVVGTVVRSSIVAGNTNSDIDNVISGTGGSAISSGTYNIIGTGNASAVFTGTGDQTGVTVPGLGPLANNGGLTETHSLLVGSPAVDSGDTTSSLLFDQRGLGFPRLLGPRVDSGAIESPVAAALSIEATDATKSEGDSATTAFTFTVTRTGNTVGATTVEYAVTGSGATPTDAADFGGSFPAGTVNFDDGQSTQWITIDVSGDLDIEPDEGFTVTLSNPLAPTTIGNATALGSIINDDLLADETIVGLDGALNLLIQDVNGGTSNDSISISIINSNVRVYDPNQTLSAASGATRIDANTVEIPIASITGPLGIVVDTLDGDDTLTIDFAGGVFGLPIRFDGGDQNSTAGDTLVLTGGNAFASATFVYSNANDGSIALAGSALITYTGLEPITSLIDVVDVTLNFSAASETISISDVGGGRTLVDSDLAGEATEFKNPVGSLSIFTGDGDNVVLINSLATDFLSDFLVQGGNGSDQVRIDGAITLAASNLNINADSIQINQAVDSAGGDIVLNATGDIRIAAGISSGGGLFEANADSDANGAGEFRLVASSAGGFGTQTQKLNAGDGAGSDYFGTSVSISGDYAIVGALLDDASAADTGSAYLFRFDGTSWIEHQKLTPADAALGDRFGNSVSIDGDTAVIGSFENDPSGSNSGAAYVFVNVGGVWTQQQKLTAADGVEADNFGSKVAISGDTIIVSATNDDDAGSSSGSVYVFNRSGNVWSQQQKLVASNAASFHYFGGDLAIDGDAAVIGAPGAGVNTGGAAYVFRRSAGMFTQEQILGASDPMNADNFARVAIDGNTIAVGVPLDDDNGGSSGSAYVFTYNGATWTQQQKVVASDAAGGDNFGWFVSVDNDTLLVGAYKDQLFGGDAGAAYVYERSAGTWTQSRKLVANDRASGDQFGGSVAVKGDHILVGAGLDDDKGSNSGSVYAFRRAAAIAGGAVASGAGAISISSAAIDLQGTLSGTSSLELRPSVSNLSIGVGGGAGVFNLDDAELARLNDGFSSITVGNPSSGTGVVDLTSAALNDPLTIAGGVINDGTGNDIVAPQVTLVGNVSPGRSPGILAVVGDLVIADDAFVTLEVGGVIPGTAANHHDQISVNGSLLLGNNVTLQMSSVNGFVVVPGNAFTLIENDGNDPISGTFAGLSEGAVIPNFMGSTLSASITYVGGSGNDAVITVEPPPMSAVLTVTTNGNEAGPIDIVYTVTLDRPNNTGSAITFDVADLLTGSATPGDDYAAITPGTKISVATGSSSGSLTIPVLNDSVVEDIETISVQISAPSLAGISIDPSAATATIADNDDSSVVISVSAGTIMEDSPGALTFTFTRDNVDAQSPGLTVSYEVGGAASASTDYSIHPLGVVEFALGSAIATVTIDPNADSLIEADESVTISLIDDVGYRLGDNPTATALILNDDLGGSTAQVQSIVYYNEDADRELGYSSDDSGQRSILRKIRITFSGPITVPIGVVSDDSFIVESIGGLKSGTRVGLEVIDSQLVAGQQVVTLKFTGTQMIEAMSRNRRNVDAMLIDGEYRLTIDGAKLGIDANGASYGSSRTDDFYRRFGDSDGDGDVDSADHDRFFAYYDDDEFSSLFDFDANSARKAVDQSEFISRYGNAP